MAGFHHVHELLFKLCDLGRVKLVKVASYTTINDCNLLLNSHRHCKEKVVSLRKNFQELKHLPYICIKNKMSICNLNNLPYCPCFSSSVRRTPRFNNCWVEASRSEPNWAKAATSRYWANSSFMEPATCNLFHFYQNRFWTSYSTDKWSSIHFLAVKTTWKSKLCGKD